MYSRNQSAHMCSLVTPRAPQKMQRRGGLGMRLGFCCTISRTGQLIVRQLLVPVLNLTPLLAGDLDDTKH
jgi:hypothetical protein